MTDILATAANTEIQKLTEEQALVTPQKQNGCNEDEEEEEPNTPPPPTSPFVLKQPSTNSKLILQNMEEVLSSVKKKHRQKHKRKKEQKRLAQLAEMELKGEGELPANGKVKQPLRDKSAQENGLQHAAHNKSKHGKSRKSPLKYSTPVTEGASILVHFQRTPKKESPPAVAVNDDDIMEVQAAEELPTAAETETASKTTTTTKPANIFELMMSARNRSIGTNPNGQELLATSPTVETKHTNVKRKLMLQEWADRKGGTKRKHEEEERAAYVEEVLDQRAKRFKKMLTKPDSKTTETIADETKESKKGKQPLASGGKRKKRSRARRLASVDSVESVDLCTTNTPPDKETAEFLAKLSSPTKKRDSLLGYFPKTESPKDLLEKAAATAATKSTTCDLNTPTSETPKRRARSKAIQNEDANATPSGRPRRSCAGKARYDYDIEPSPTKNKKDEKSVKSDKSTAGTPKTKAADISIEIIDLDNSNPPILQTPKKLAPLFVRQMPKPSPCPTVLRAREEFLRSGVPEKLKQEQVKQKQFEQHFEDTYEHFPRISHVQQYTEQEIELLAAKLPTSSIKMREINAYEDITEISSMPSGRSRKSKTNTVGCIANLTPADFQQPWRSQFRINQLPTIETKRNIVKSWKTEYERFPTYKCYNQMCEKYRYFRAIDSAQESEQVNESFVVTRRSRRSLEPANSEDKPPATAPNGELLFSEKYKPLLYEQVLVNLTPVQQLREFLSTWTTGSMCNNTPTSSARNSQNLDDTFDFANDSNSTSAMCNTVVLLGPSSSGKTNAVYALANDLNFNVLEVNAGMKRTGKKLLQELQEATQSHQIRKDNKSEQSKQLLKRSLNGLKAKQKKAATTSDEDTTQSVRKSLILIEDADIVFDQMDAGFTDAIYTLAATSKRPVIVVASDPNCAHLQRLQQQNVIYFQQPHVLSISKFLSVLALIENCPIQLDDLVSLFSYNNKNLRKTLLELQFFIQSGGDQRKVPELPLTPQKNGNGKQTATTAASSPYYASPSKKSLVENQSDQMEQDEQLVRVKDELATVGKKSESSQEIYKHNTLFDFYTCAQNMKYRIPFPVDFHLLWINLNDIMHVSDNLQPSRIKQKTNTTPNKNTKRKSRSPKKAWLNSAKNEATSTDLDALNELCEFYNNIEIAVLLGNCDAQNCTDRLVPHLSEHIAHSLVEQSLVTNLAARTCPYNLFDTPLERHSMCDQLSSTQLRTRQARYLDYEPALREICRSEKLRENEERRSSRFYHYLRNYTLNIGSFSTEHYEAVCDIFRIEKDGENTTEQTTETTNAT